MPADPKRTIPEMQAALAAQQAEAAAKAAALTEKIQQQGRLEQPLCVLLDKQRALQANLEGLRAARPYWVNTSDEVAALFQRQLFGLVPGFDNSTAVRVFVLSLSNTRPADLHADRIVIEIDRAIGLRTAELEKVKQEAAAYAREHGLMRLLL